MNKLMKVLSIALLSGIALTSCDLNDLPSIGGNGDKPHEEHRPDVKPDVKPDEKPDEPSEAEMLLDYATIFAKGYKAENEYKGNQSAIGKVLTTVTPFNIKQNGEIGNELLLPAQERKLSDIEEIYTSFDFNKERFDTYSVNKSSKDDYQHIDSLVGFGKNGKYYQYEGYYKETNNDYKITNENIKQISKGNCLNGYVNEATNAILFNNIHSYIGSSFNGNLQDVMDGINKLIKNIPDIEKYQEYSFTNLDGKNIIQYKIQYAPEFTIESIHIPGLNKMKVHDAEFSAELIFNEKGIYGLDYNFDFKENKILNDLTYTKHYKTNVNLKLDHKANDSIIKIHDLDEILRRVPLTEQPENLSFWIKSENMNANYLVKGTDCDENKHLTDEAIAKIMPKLNHVNITVTDEADNLVDAKNIVMENFTQQYTLNFKVDPGYALVIKLNDFEAENRYQYSVYDVKQVSSLNMRDNNITTIYQGEQSNGNLLLESGKVHFDK